MKRLSACLLATVLIAGCANRPDAIAPATVPMAAYANLSCQQIGIEHQRETAALAALSTQQNRAASNDAFGVFLIGVPMSSAFGGDKEGEIAVTKGKIVAMDAALMSKGCVRSS